ncbi:MAG: hypothetical protein PHO92_01200 [Candidatus Peribacteraceae bacterium]|nr:hypothetical protein [Candidatus Peribacteraceae bacterium]
MERSHQRDAICTTPHETCIATKECSPIHTAAEELLTQMRTLLSDEYCTHIATVIGDRAHAPDIREIVARSNTEGHMFHGIKRATYIPGILRLGIDMDAPELGGCANESFWTSGKEIFGKDVCKNGHGYDTSFFDYGHAYDPSGLRTVMALAVTNPDIVRKVLNREYPFQRDGYMTVPFAVPRNAMHLLLTEIHHTHPPADTAACRQRGQRSEQIMLSLMHQALCEGYEPGGVTRVSLQEEA